MKICDQLSKHVAIEPIQVECEMAQLPSALAVGMVSTSEHSAKDQSKTWMTITWISLATAIILFFGLVYMAPSADTQGMATVNHSTKYNSAISGPKSARANVTTARFERSERVWNGKAAGCKATIRAKRRSNYSGGADCRPETACRYPAGSTRGSAQAKG